MEEYSGEWRLIRESHAILFLTVNSFLNKRRLRLSLFPLSLRNIYLRIGSIGNESRGLQSQYTRQDICMRRWYPKLLLKMVLTESRISKVTSINGTKEKTLWDAWFPLKWGFLPSLFYIWSFELNGNNLQKLQ